MAGIIFVIGLEIKREALVGELAGWHRASLPTAGALDGMVVPALIYVAFIPVSRRSAAGACRWRPTSRSHSAC